MTPVELLTRFMLALCVWREARNQSALGKRLVADTVLNRVRDARWPNTVCGVVTQPKQFSSFNAGDPNATLFPLETDLAWAESVGAAIQALSSSPMTTANHYVVDSLRPRPGWFDEKRVVVREGAHVFLTL